MQNELREKEELTNPMDAVRGKNATRSERRSEKKQASNKSTSTASSGQKSKAKRQNILIQVLNGEILTRDFVLNNLTFIFFILLLLMLMVAKGYYGKQLQKDINDLQADVDAKSAEFIENKAHLEETTTRYRLVQALEKTGLKEAINPAKVIRLKPKKDE
jgi:cell division protein FtsL